MPEVALSVEREETDRRHVIAVRVVPDQWQLCNAGGCGECRDDAAGFPTSADRLGIASAITHRTRRDRLVEAVVLGRPWLLTAAAIRAVRRTVHGTAWCARIARAATFRPLRYRPRALLCDVRDLVLVISLLVLVAVASYDNYISRIATPATGSPEWLGKHDSCNVAVKVVVAVTMIFTIRLHAHS